MKDRSPLTEAGSDSKLGEIISFTYTSSLTWVQVEGNAQLGTWAPHQRFLDQIQDLAKLSEGGLKKTLGNLTRSNSLCSTAKAKSKSRNPTRVEARVLRPRNRPRSSDQVTSAPASTTRAVDKTEGLTSSGKLPSSSVPISVLDQRLHQGVGILGSEGQVAQGNWDLSVAELHINVLELMTIVKALDILEVTDQTLVVWLDNQLTITVGPTPWVTLS